MFENKIRTIALIIAGISAFIFIFSAVFQSKNNLDRELKRVESFSFEEGLGVEQTVDSSAGIVYRTYGLNPYYDLKMEYPKKVLQENSSEVNVKVDSVNFTSNPLFDLKLARIKLTFGTNAFSTIPDSVIYIPFRQGASNNILIDPLSVGKKRIRIKSELLIPEVSIGSTRINSRTEVTYMPSVKDHSIEIEVIDNSFLGLTLNQIDNMKNISAMLGIPSIIIFLLTFLVNRKKTIQGDEQNG